MEKVRKVPKITQVVISAMKLDTGLKTVLLDNNIC